MIDVGIYTSCMDHHGYGIFVSISRFLGFSRRNQGHKLHPAVRQGPCLNVRPWKDLWSAHRWVVGWLVRLVEWLVTSNWFVSADNWVNWFMKIEWDVSWFLNFVGYMLVYILVIVLSLLVCLLISDCWWWSGMAKHNFECWGFQVDVNGLIHVPARKLGSMVIGSIVKISGMYLYPLI